MGIFLHAVGKKINVWVKTWVKPVSDTSDLQIVLNNRYHSHTERLIFYTRFTRLLHAALNCIFAATLQPNAFVFYTRCFFTRRLPGWVLSTISSYTLRWNGSSVPSNPNVIQELHWSNYTMAQTINLGTGKIELTIGHPTGMATQTWTNTQLALKAKDADVTLAFAGYNVLLSQKAETSQVLTNVPANAVFTDTLYTHPSQHSISMITGLQTELNKISGLKTGVSGLSLGGGTGAAHRFAVHEVEIGDPYHTAGSYMYGMGLSRSQRYV